MIESDFLETELAHVSRPIPEGLSIVSNSVPITAFGNFEKARVATLSLNPSYLEFTNKLGFHMSPPKNRVLSRRHLNLANHETVSEADAIEVIRSFRNYFNKDANPYNKWFSPMERWVVTAVGASYWKGSATHLDLSQWATNPIWNGLKSHQINQMLDTDLPFLKSQLEHRQFELVLLNGATVISEVNGTGLVKLELVEEVDADGTKVEFYAGNSLGTRFLGWNWYLQAAISNQVRIAISDWLKKHAE